MRDHLAELLLPVARGEGTQLLTVGTCTAWSATAPYNSTVVVGSVTYLNLSVLNPAAMSVGRVVLMNAPGQPIILGRLYPGT